MDRNIEIVVDFLDLSTFETNNVFYFINHNVFFFFKLIIFFIIFFIFKFEKLK